MSKLIQEIESLKEFAEVTYGDGLSADEATKRQITQFYESYPALQWDASLSEFFYTYLALTVYKEGSITASVLGFDKGVTMSILYTDEFLKNNDEFLKFAESSIRLDGKEYIGFNYAYDITGTRPKYIF